MSTILIAEDSASLVQDLQALFIDQGFNVVACASAEEGCFALEEQPISLAVLDLGLAQGSGFDILDRIRARHPDIPVIIMTARDTINERVQGLDRGADDYITKPFDFAELLARCRAHLRRRSTAADDQVSLGELVYHRSNKTCSIQDQLCKLSSKETALLEALIERPTNVVFRERLFQTLYADEDGATPNALDLLVSRLRKRLKGSGCEIVTIRGLGYMLREQDGAPDAAPPDAAPGDKE